MAFEINGPRSCFAEYSSSYYIHEKHLMDVFPNLRTILRISMTLSMVSCKLRDTFLNDQWYKTNQHAREKTAVFPILSVERIAKLLCYKNLIKGDVVKILLGKKYYSDVYGQSLCSKIDIFSSSSPLPPNKTLFFLFLPPPALLR